MIDHPNPSYPTSPSASARWQSIAPIITLIVLSPVLVELLAGIVHITNIWLLVPEMGVYGLAAVLIREVVRRLHAFDVVPDGPLLVPVDGVGSDGELLYKC